MRRTAFFAWLVAALVTISGCAAGEMLTNLFGGRNSDEADLKQINQGNQFAPD